MASKTFSERDPFLTQVQMPVLKTNGKAAGSQQTDSLRTSGPLKPILQIVSIPAAVAATDQVAFAWGQSHAWSVQSYAVVLPLLVGQVALLAVIAGRRMKPAALKWFVYGWSLVLVDLIVFSAMLSTELDWWNPGLSALGYALLAGQLGGLVIWLILGDASWPWRMAVFLVLAAALVVLLERIATAHGTWRAHVWPVILLIQSGIVLLVSLLLRLAGMRIRPSDPGSTSTSKESLQFSLHHLLVWTTAVCCTLVMLRGVDVFILRSLEMQELLPAAIIGISLATGSLTALWAALGGSHWLVRLCVLVVVACSSGLALKVAGDFWAPPPAAPGFNLLLRYIQTTGHVWMVWTALHTSFLAALLLFFRAQGLRLVRQARRAG